MLCATTACTFSTSQLPKVLRTRHIFTLLTSKCASLHNGVHFFDISTSKIAPRLRCFVHFGVQFFISHLASWLRTRRFSEPTFRPATNHWKNTVFPGSSFFGDFLFLIVFLLLFSSFLFSSLTLPISAFHLSILPEV